ncbi:MAG: AAA family ATPase [Thermodesulfobacteriota bacterium]
MKAIQVKPVFVKTKNVRNFEVMMDGLDMAAGEGRLGLVYGRAGRGKTRTSQWYHAQKGGVYLRAVTIWSPTNFLAALCRELGSISPPKRKGAAFEEAVTLLMASKKPVFIDEIEKMPSFFLDLVRDLSDLSATPFVLVGEEELVTVMRRNRRVWSRTYQQIEFKPIDPADVIIYAKEAAELAIDPRVAAVLHKASEGDFRIVRRDLLSLVQYANAKGTKEITPEMASTATKAGLHG